MCLHVESALDLRIARLPRERITCAIQTVVLAAARNGASPRGLQAISMSRPIDEHTASDVVVIAEARNLSVPQLKCYAECRRRRAPQPRCFPLGAGKRRVRHIWCRSRQTKDFDPIDLAIEIVMNPASGMRQALARHCTGQSGVSVTGTGIRLICQPFSLRRRGGKLKMLWRSVSFSLPVMTACCLRLLWRR